MRHVLVAADSPGSPAVAWAASLAGSMSSDLVVATTCAAAPEAVRTVRRVADMHGAPFLRFEVLDGDQIQTLVERSMTADVGYLVISKGCEGRSRTRTIEAVDHVMRYTSTPLVVVGDTGPIPAGPLVVGVDNSWTSAAVLAIAANLATDLSTGLVIGCFESDTRGKALQRETALSDELLGRIGVMGRCEPEVVPIKGNPVDALTALARSRQATALLVGAVDRIGASRATVDSPALDLIERSPVPLVLVPAVHQVWRPTGQRCPPVRSAGPDSRPPIERIVDRVRAMSAVPRRLRPERRDLAPLRFEHGTEHRVVGPFGVSARC